VSAIIISLRAALDRVGSFLRRYGWFVLFALAVVGTALAAIFSRRKTPLANAPTETLKAELSAIQAEGALERKIAEVGLNAATAYIELEYQKQRADLGVDAQREAESLRGDPVELAKFLARAGSRRSAPH